MVCILNLPVNRPVVHGQGDPVTLTPSTSVRTRPGAGNGCPPPGATFTLISTVTTTVVSTVTSLVSGDDNVPLTETVTVTSTTTAVSVSTTTATVRQVQTRTQTVTAVSTVYREVPGPVSTVVREVPGPVTTRTSTVTVTSRGNAVASTITRVSVSLVTTTLSQCSSSAACPTLTSTATACRSCLVPQCTETVSVTRPCGCTAASLPTAVVSFPCSDPGSCQRIGCTTRYVIQTARC